MIFLERTREGHHLSDEQWNRFKGDVGETSDRRDVAHMGFFRAHRHHLVPNYQPQFNLDESEQNRARTIHHRINDNFG